MNSSQRRSGFRLPWSGEPSGEEETASATVKAAGSATPISSEPAVSPIVGATAPVTPDPAPVSSAPAPTPAPAARPQRPAAPEPSKELLRDLVEAMRGVAEDARATSLEALRAEVDERIGHISSQGDEHAAKLRSRAEADIVGIGDWAKAEAERIRNEAEARVAKRRQQLESQLTAESKRAERESDETGARVTEYERELDSFFAQLTEIADPSAFAAAVKRMPRPPQIPTATAPRNGNGEAAVGVAPLAEPESVQHNGSSSATESEASGTDAKLAGRLAELDAELDAPEQLAPADAAAEPVADGPAVDTTTVIIVKGLGSFGAVTAFKQTLEDVEGIDSVTLSLGSTGEFAYRAIHKSSFDIEKGIGGLDGGSVERQPDGALRLTMSRGR